MRKLALANDAILIKQLNSNMCESPKNIVSRDRLKKLGMAIVFSLASLGNAHAQVSGEVKCNQAGKPNWGFKIASAVGYFDLTTGAFSLKFFADSLSAAELKYYVGDQSGYADAGQEFEKIPKLDERLKAVDKRTMVVWGEIKENSTAKLEAMPAVHTKAELTGINVSSCSNLGGHSASVRDAESVLEMIQEFSFPTTPGVHNTTFDVKYLEERQKGDQKLFSAKGNATFYVFKSPA